MEEPDDYRSSDDEDYDGAGSDDAEDAEEVTVDTGAKAKGATGKRRRSARHDDGLEELDASEAADLKAAAQEMYGAAFLAEAAAVQATSALTAAKLDAIWADMNTEQQRPRLVLVGGVPLSSHAEAARASRRDQAGAVVDLAFRGVLGAAAFPPPPRARLASNRSVALEVSAARRRLRPEPAGHHSAPPVFEPAGAAAGRRRGA